MAGQNEVLAGIAADIGQINKQIEQANELIGAAREAGETTATLEADLRSLQIRKKKWEDMLKARGYTIPQA